MTYSLAVVGRNANHKFVTSPVTNISSTIGVLDLLLSDQYATPGRQANAAMTGAQVLCQLPDGSQRYFVLDAERSLPGAPVMRRV